MSLNKCYLIIVLDWGSNDPIKLQNKLISNSLNCWAWSNYEIDYLVYLQ